jgi:hypothetical protein
VQRRAELREAHAAAHPAESAQEPGDLGVVAAHDAVQVDDQHAVLHVLDDEAVDLLQVRDVDAALSGELFRGFRVSAKGDCDPDRREIAEADESGLKRLRSAHLALQHPPHVEAEQDEAREGGVEERRLRAQEPAACGQLRKEQDRERTTGGAARHHHQRDAQDVAGEKRRHEARQAQRQRLALHDPERGEAEDEIDRAVRQEEIRRRNAEHLEIEQQRRAEQRRSADRAIDADDPQDPAGGLGLRQRWRHLLDRRRERRRGSHRRLDARHHRGLVHAGSPQVRPAGPGMASFCGR